VTAARFVHPGGADQHAVAAGDQPLRVVRRIAADDADGQRLGDVFGNREELRHRLERTAQVVLIQTRDDHTFPAVRERVARGRQVRVEELPFVNPDDLGVVVDALHELVGALHALRRHTHVAVRDDVIFAVAVVDERLEDLDLLLRNLRAAQPANELLALAAEHAAGDDFDPAMLWLAAHDVHVRPWIGTRRFPC